MVVVSGAVPYFQAIEGVEGIADIEEGESHTSPDGEEEEKVVSGTKEKGLLVNAGVQEATANKEILSNNINNPDCIREAMPARRKSRLSPCIGKHTFYFYLLER
jgi:hypothetical protein